MERADIMGELTVNCKLFGTEAAKHMVCNIAISVTRQVFNEVNILRTQDCTAGSLNDSGTSQITRSEMDSGTSNAKRGRAMFPFRNRITNVRNVGNRLVDNMFTVVHNSDSKWGDLVTVECERAFRFMLDAYGLTDIATKFDDVEVAISIMVDSNVSFS